MHVLTYGFMRNLSIKPFTQNMWHPTWWHQRDLASDKYSSPVTKCFQLVSITKSEPPAHGSVKTTRATRYHFYPFQKISTKATTEQGKLTSTQSVLTVVMNKKWCHQIKGHCCVYILPNWGVNFIKGVKFQRLCGSTRGPVPANSRIHMHGLFGQWPECVFYANHKEEHIVSISRNELVGEVD